MAKILTFRGKEEGSADLDFLADETQTLSFRTPEDGSTVSLGQIPQASLFPDPKKDWSNQELADLFKVRQLLSGANVVVETDRGVTDEGDPWFVFCHGSGEVFIHLCRVDGLYLLDSPNVMRPLRGANFAELIADFTNQALPAGGDTDSGTERRVIRLERGGKVRLHPSAMLAALIWTLFLASEELVLMAPEETDVAYDDDSLLNFEGMFAIEGGEQVLTGGLFEDEVTMVTTQPKDVDQDAMDFVPETQGQIREAALHQQGLTAQHNCFSIGLSTIAIAMGFMSEAVLLDNQRKVLEQLKQLGFTEYGKDPEAPIEVHIADTEGDVTLLTMLADFLGIDLSEDSEFAQAVAATLDAPSLLQQQIAHSIDSAVTTVNETLPSAKAAQAAALKDEAFDEADEAPADLDLRPTKTIDTVTATKVETTASQTTDVTETDTLTLSDVIKEMQLGQLTTLSSFDLTTDTSFALFKAGSEPARVVDLHEFEGLAQRLSDFFSNKGTDLGFIEQSYGFIAIDRDAIRSGEDVEHIQWRTDNGKVISVIGLQADFEYFDMIA